VLITAGSNGAAAVAESGARPLIAVVIPTFNSGAVLAAALESLADQVWLDFEVVISDGGSRDNTVSIAKAHADRLPHLLIDSRPDSGVYDAINRGVRASTAEWFLVLGSDDKLHAADTLERLARVVSGPARVADGAGIVHGDVRMMAANHHGVPPGGRYGGPAPLARLLRENICQQALLYRRSLFDQLGGFDLRYPIYADWHFNLRAAFRGDLLWVDQVVADYAATGISGQRVDTAFLADMDALVRQELMAQRGQPRLAPARRELLRQADRARRGGRWSEAWAALRLWWTWG
jgi:GT2 family glycosyltransferase